MERIKDKGGSDVEAEDQKANGEGPGQPGGSAGKELKPDAPIKKSSGFRSMQTKFGSRLSPKLQRKKAKPSVALMKVFPNELEQQKEFSGFTEWLQTFELYRYDNKTNMIRMCGNIN